MDLEHGGAGYMSLMRWTLCLLSLIAVSLPAIAAPAKPKPAAEAPLRAPEGRSLATASGARLFPLYAGEAMPGWLAGFNGPAMRIAYRGMPAREPLPGGRTLAVLRHDQLLGAYVFAGDRCIGHLLFEPFLLDAPEAFLAHLARGARPRQGLLATRDRRYALDATTYERRRGALLERRVVVSLPLVEDGRRLSRPALGLEAILPADLVPIVAPYLEEGQDGLVRFWHERPAATP